MHVPMDRRRFLSHGAAALGGAAAALTVADPAWGNEGFARPGPSPYGDLDGRSPDRNGLVLPEGFTSRVVAIGGETVAGTDYRWHPFSDGGATIADGRGGWYYVSNSEVFDPIATGGVSALHFDAQGKIAGAEQILGGTTGNCAGGATPWGTWLSCEEIDRGHVWECDPSGARAPTRHDALGAFRHEAVAVDESSTSLFLTEDEPDGLLYRFVPDQWPDLSRGRLQALRVEAPNTRWLDVPDASAATTATRHQVSGATVFPGGEGICARAGFVYFTTRDDNRVHVLDLRRGTYAILWDGTEPLSGVDNITADPVAGQLFIAEEGGNMEVVVIGTNGGVAPFLRVVGHPDSEVAGVSFSPDARRLYFSSQRAPTDKRLQDVIAGAADARPIGKVYEVEGPFLARQTAAARLVGRTGGGDNRGGSSSPAPYIAVGGSLVVAGLVGALVVRNRRNQPADTRR
jgi:secreted PhoX family phosphatase